jgi:uncharacterized protein YciI
MPLYLYRIEPARPGMPLAPTAEEQTLIGQHFEHLRAAHARGQVKYVGRTDEPPFIGLALLEAADGAAAEDFYRADPAVAAGVFRGGVQRFLEILPFSGRAPG